MMRLAYRFVPVILAVATLAVVACTSSMPAPRPMPILAYQKYPPMRVNVGRVEVVDNYTSGQYPNIEGQMALPLPQAVHDWAQNRFQANGQDGVLTITIDRASVVTDNLQRTTGVKGWLTVDQAQRLSGQIVVRFAATGMSFGTSGNAMVEVKSSRTVPEDASLQQQDVILANLTDSMFTELDAGTQRVFNEKLPSLMQQGGMR